MNTIFNKSLTKDCIFYNLKNTKNISEIWNEFISDKLNRNLYLAGENLEELKDIFFGHFKIINAAGGIVINSKKQLLCIYRLNKWDLPKGKVERNETVEIAAVREVEEETGISGVEIKDLNRISYHIYKSPHHKKRLILKPTYWFNMYYSGDEQLVPQEKESISKAVWVDSNNFEDMRKNTYASLKDLFNNNSIS